jgi:hypothetical protein
MHNRKKFFVSGAIQGRVLAQLCSYWLLYNFLLWHATFLIEALPSEGVPAPLFERYAAFCSQHTIWLVCMLFVFPVILWDMVKLTHGVAGPLVRLERVVRQMARGEAVSTVVLREHDMLGQFVEALNELIEAHNRRLEAGNQTAASPSAPEAGEPESHLLTASFRG